MWDKDVPRFMKLGMQTGGVFQIAKPFFNRRPKHHNTTRPQVAGRGEGLQIRMVAGNVLNKQ
jgi:hypothetical protein